MEYFREFLLLAFSVFIWVPIVVCGGMALMGLLSGDFTTLILFGTITWAMVALSRAAFPL